MRLLIRHAPALSNCGAVKKVPGRLSSISGGGLSTGRPWICQQCYSQRTVNAKKSRQLSESAIRGSTILSRSPLNGNRLYSQDKPSPKEPNNGPTKQRSDLPSQEEGRRSQISKKFSHVMDHLQSNVFIAGQRLNDLTGYSGIEALKKDIEQQESLVQTTRASLQKAREAYSAAIAQRSGSQREVNGLLQRKHAWTPNDLERFTALYRSDHANEQAEIAAQDKLAALERKAEEAGAKLSACILARYHEEQIWSDKIRRMSTWGTWGLMGVNVLLFLVFQIGVEPWRRRRLVKGFEDKVMEALEREGGAATALGEMQAPQGTPIPALDAIEVDPVPAAEETLPTPQIEMQEQLSPIEAEVEQTVTEEILKASIPMSTLGSVRESIRDMFSERQVTIRRVDLTTAMMEGAAAGVAFVGVLVFLLRPQ